MLYLVCVLTFLCGILFYSLSPRDDQLTWDMRRAEGFVLSFLSQHQAAKDYIFTWLGLELSEQPNSYFSLDSVGKNDGYETVGKFIVFSPIHIGNEVADNQGSTPNIAQAGNLFQTSVYCLDSNEELIPCDNDDLTDVYLVTFGNRPEWWPDENSNRQRRFGSWRRSISERTRGSYNCGTLTCVDDYILDGENAGLCRRGESDQGRWCVDNGQRVFLPKTRECARKVPLSITNQLGCHNTPGLCQDILFCISRVKNGASDYYVPGLTAFFDGIRNTTESSWGEAERYGGQQGWRDLINPEDEFMAIDPNSGEGVYFVQEDRNVGNATPDGYLAAKLPVSFPKIFIANSASGPYRDFSLTLLLKGSRGNDYDIGFLKLNKLRFGLAKDGDDYSLYVSHNGVTIQTEDLKFDFWRSPSESEVRQLKPDEQIISVTVIGSSGKIDVYINNWETPVLTINKTDIDLSAEYSQMATEELEISNIRNNDFFIYGVRYYQGKRLTTTRELINGSLRESELEKNFSVDSRRFGIFSSRIRRNL